MSKRLGERAKQLRAMTTPEVLLWTRIRGTELHIRRQHPVDRFVTDFYCAIAKTVVEVDGEIHEPFAERDAARDHRLYKRGLRTIRIEAKAILIDPDAVAEALLATLRQIAEENLSD